VRRRAPHFVSTDPPPLGISNALAFARALLSSALPAHVVHMNTIITQIVRGVMSNRASSSLAASTAPAVSLSLQDRTRLQGQSPFSVYTPLRPTDRARPRALPMQRKRRCPSDRAPPQQKEGRGAREV